MRHEPAGNPDELDSADSSQRPQDPSHDETPIDRGTDDTQPARRRSLRDTDSMPAAEFDRQQIEDEQN